MSGVAGLVLAAGASRRIGRPKMLLPFGSGTVLSSVVGGLLEAGLDPVVVVLGHGAEEVERRAALPQDPRLKLVVNEGWTEGMASSIRRGLEACPEASAVVLALGDQPGLDAARVRRILTAWNGQAALVVPVADGRVGHPVLFGRELFPELRALAGEAGARDVVRRHWAQARQVPLPLLRDIDTEDDYRAARAGEAAPPDEGMELP